MADKNYISGILIKKFGQYGQLSISIKLEDFIGQLQAIENNGWVNIVIAENKNPTAKGWTHHCFENTWKPSDKADNKIIAEKATETTDNDDLPF